MLHPQFFLFLSISLRKGAFLLGRKSVPFWVKVRSFSKDRPYLLREKSAPFLWRARSSSLELLSYKYTQLVLMNNPNGLKLPPLLIVLLVQLLRGCRSCGVLQKDCGFVFTYAFL